MINNLILSGVVDSKCEKENKLIIKVKRAYKDIEGIYKEDYIECFLWNGYINEFVKHFKINDTVILKGRVEVENKVKIIAERIITLKKAN